MSYQMWIPVFNRRWNEKQKEELVTLLREAECDLVLLTYERILCDREMQENNARLYQENREFLLSRGFAVGAWLFPTIGYGAAFYGDGEGNRKFRHMRTLRGAGEGDLPGAFCPRDEGFTDELIYSLTLLADMGTEIIMLEDDFTLGGGKVWQDMGCACETCLAKYNARVGEALTRAEIADKIFSGGKSRYRDAWIEEQKDALISLCQKIEKRVHEKHPHVRLGISANGSSFEMEGTTADELAYAIAGKTKPFMRLTGAPYWRQMDKIAPSIEAVRLQSVWCDKDKIDLITEGDTYPRPRAWVPAAELEAYDMILRADGRSFGILKYMLDYNASPSYEAGYVHRHAKNKPHYTEIARRFAGGKTVGLHLYEHTMTLRDRLFDEDLSIHTYRANCGGYLPLAEQWMLTDCSVPITYESDDAPMMVIGENARYVTEEELMRGAIIDVQAAKRLIERGIDVGIEKMERAPVPFGMYFRASNDYTLASLPEGGIFYDITPKAGAVVDSEFILCPRGLGVLPVQGMEGYRRFPAIIRYENARGMKFAILSFMPETVATKGLWTPGIFRNYRMQRAFGDLYAYLAGKPLPAMCYDAPFAYLLCKREGKSLSVALFNLFADEILSPTIELDGKYTHLDIYHAKGHLDGDRLIIEEDIPPYGFLFFTVSK